MANLEINNLHIKYDDFHAVKGVTVNVKDSEILSLLGPSGCGKTSILRAVAGFINPADGSIVVDGENITDLPAQKRNMGMIFQNYALWPHMSVKENIGYGLKLRKVPKEERDTKIADLIKQVQLKGQEDKYPGQLSGGQQQRVSLARGLAIEPKVLLCDEPLSNLDFKLRVELRNEIRRIAKEFGITVVYVTHDQTEALAISDKIAVIDEGVIIQSASPETIYSDPNNHFVGKFVGENNLVDGKVAAVEGNKVTVELHSGDKFINSITHKDKIPDVGSRIQSIIRQDKLHLTNQAGAGVLEGKLSYKAFMGNFLQIEVALKDKTNVMANIPIEDGKHGLEDADAGSPVFLSIEHDQVFLFDDSNNRI